MEKLINEAPIHIHTIVNSVQWEMYKDKDFVIYRYPITGPGIRLAIVPVDATFEWYDFDNQFSKYKLNITGKELIDATYASSHMHDQQQENCRIYIESRIENKKREIVGDTIHMNIAGNNACNNALENLMMK